MLIFPLFKWQSHKHVQGRDYKYNPASFLRFLSDLHIKTGVIKSPIQSTDPDSEAEISATAFYCPHES